MIVVLDNIRSLYNVGSIFRSADGFGIEKIYLCGTTGTPPRKEISKTALGADEVVEFEYFKHTKDCIENLKKIGFTIVSLEKNETSIDINSFKWPKQTVLVVGNEIVGISNEILKLSDHVVHISMEGIKESFNVASATAVAMFSEKNFPQT
jgi:tRNA G18 (ribose-2'-O)-methylase SpoU